MADSGTGTQQQQSSPAAGTSSSSFVTAAAGTPSSSFVTPVPFRSSNQATSTVPLQSTQTTQATQEWEIQTTRRLESLFFSHTMIEPHGLSMFANLLRQYEDDGKIINDDLLSRFFLMVSLWGLARIHNVSDLESRRQFGVFINHLQDAETALLKAIQIHHKTLVAKSVPPTRTVQSLPISTTSQL